MKKNKSWYAEENGKFIIEIKAERLEQLFDKRDPNPFRLKDLDDDAAEYIISSAFEIGANKIAKIRIITTEDLSQETIQEVSRSIQDYFLYRSDIVNKKIRSTFSTGFKALAIGMTFLSVSIGVSAFLNEAILKSFIGSFLKEGLLLLGWVSMWKPVNIFLYDWWPEVEMRNLHLALSEMKIEIINKEDHILSA